MDVGGSRGKGPWRVSADYEKLWRSTLRRAFKGGRIEASARGERFTRSWMHDHADKVRASRNRAAHHEPLIHGVPLPGRRDAAVSRLDVTEAHDELLLLRCIDRNLATWVEQNSELRIVWSRRPDDLDG